MPELPDVESFKKYMDSTSLNKKIKKVDVFDKKILSGISAKNFQLKLKEKKFNSTFRHGKYLFVNINKNESVVMHFGMTGFLKYFKNKNEASNHIRIQFNFSNGYHLGFDCLRKFGRVTFVENPDEFIKKKKLGIDPVNTRLSFKKFKEIFEKKSGNIKAALLNQTLLAGIGNIYSDEILFQAGIHPASSISKLKNDKLKKIFSSMNKVLRKAIEADAEPKNFPQSYLLLRRKKDAKCPKCEGKIKMKTIGGRSSYFCSKHQK